MVFYFGLFLPLVFVSTSFALTKKEQLFNSLLSSVSILMLFYLGLLINRTIGGLSFLNYEAVKFFNGFESISSVITMVLFLFGFLMTLVFFRKPLKESLTSFILAQVYICLFLVTAIVTSKNILIFLFVCESFLWLNLFQIKATENNRKFLYFLSSASTAILLVLTVFLGLLENISLSEMTYGLDNLEKISLSYVSGTLYSTQTLFFIMVLAYIALRLSFVLQVLIDRITEKNIQFSSLALILLGVPITIYCLLNQQAHFYELVYRDYGSIAIGFTALLIGIFGLAQFQKKLLSWSK